jgi:hypothetical protein
VSVDEHLRRTTGAVRVPGGGTPEVTVSEAIVTVCALVTAFAVVQYWLPRHRK